MADKLNFEESLARLQEIVDRLEQGEISLADSLKLFEEGAALSAACYETLKTAEQKITEIREKNARKDTEHAE